MLVLVWPAALHLTAARGAGLLLQRVPPAFVLGIVMSEPDLLHFHAREAARLRRLLATATTPALKARLAEQAREHEQLAEALELGEAAATVSDRPTVDD